jgi:hypothetical protein
LKIHEKCVRSVSLSATIVGSNFISLTIDIEFWSFSSRLFLGFVRNHGTKISSNILRKLAKSGVTFEGTKHSVSSWIIIFEKFVCSEIKFAHCDYLIFSHGIISCVDTSEERKAISMVRYHIKANAHRCFSNQEYRVKLPAFSYWIPYYDER